MTKAVSFSTQTPLALMGPEKALVAQNLRAFRLRAKNWQAEAEQRVRVMYEGTPLASIMRIADPGPIFPSYASGSALALIG